MPTNQGPEFAEAEKKYYAAKTTEEKIAATEDMISNSKKHKGTESLLALLKSRVKKLKESQEKAKKSGKSSHKAIKKEGFQIVLIGFPNTGKTSILDKMTNAKPKISSHPFSTFQPELGSFDYEGVKAQLVDMPSIGSDAFDIGLVNTADLILIVVDKLEEIEKILPLLKRAQGNHMIVISKSDLLSDQEKRKLEATIKSKKIHAFLISTLTGEGIKDLQESIIKKMNVSRIYLKEPGKPASSIPLVVSSGSTIKQAAEKIYKGFSGKIKETKISGPSSKFANQKVGLSHVLKDKDIVEFHTN